MSFSYNPDYVRKIKSIKDYRWHPEEKHWGFQCSDKVLTEILSVFAGEEVSFAPSLQALLSQEDKRKLANSTILIQGLCPTEPRKTRKGNPAWRSKFEDIGKEPLFDRVRDLIRLKHYSIQRSSTALRHCFSVLRLCFTVRTERTYLCWIKRYILFHNKRHPKDMGELEIEDFLSHLAQAYLPLRANSLS